MKFVIKSHKRVIAIENDTLAFLKKYDVPEESIFIFVSLDTDVIEYQKKYKNCNILKGDKGIIGIDNYIVNYFDEGSKYIYLNDDVRKIYKTGEKKKSELSKEEFWNLIDAMFDELEKKNYTYAGLYPCHSTMYMNQRPPIENLLRLIMDPFSAVINNKNIILNEFLVKNLSGDDFISNKSDFEKSLLHFLDRGGIARFNHFCISVKYCNDNGAGGYQGRDSQTELETAKQFKEKYIEYVSSYRLKKTGFSDIRFKKTLPFLPQVQVQVLPPPLD